MACLNERYGETRVIDQSLWGELMRNDWPGNVRELENYLERQWLAGGNGASRVGGAAPRLAVKSAEATVDEPRSPLSLKDALARTEKDCLQRAMRDARSTYEIATRLRISQPSVVRKLRKHALSLRRT